jgi:hypothetical protein
MSCASLHSAPDRFDLRDAALRAWCIADPIGKARPSIRFVHHEWNPAAASSEICGQCCIPAETNDDVGLEPIKEHGGLLGRAPGTWNHANEVKGGPPWHGGRTHCREGIAARRHE